MLNKFYWTGCFVWVILPLLLIPSWALALEPFLGPSADGLSLIRLSQPQGGDRYIYIYIYICIVSYLIHPIKYYNQYLNQYSTHNSGDKSTNQNTESTSQNYYCEQDREIGPTPTQINTHGIFANKTHPCSVFKMWVYIGFGILPLRLIPSWALVIDL